MSVLLGPARQRYRPSACLGSRRLLRSPAAASAAIVDSCLASASSLLNPIETNPVQIVATGVALDEDAPDVKWPEYFGGRPVVVDSMLGPGNRRGPVANPSSANMLFLDVCKTIECAVVVHGRTLGFY